MRIIFLLSIYLFSTSLQANDNPSIPLKDISAESNKNQRGQIKGQSQTLDSRKLKALNDKAKSGDIRAQRELGDRYFSGLGISQDYKKSFFWFHKAAKQGDARSQDQIGEMYFSGHGVSQNEEKAIFWFQKAAEQNYIKAQETLSALNLLTKDTISTSPKDLVESYKWTSLTGARNMSVDVFSENGITFLDYLESQMSPSEIAEAQDWTRRQFEEEIKEERKMEERKIQIQRGKTSIQESMNPYDNLSSPPSLESLTQAAKKGSASAQHQLAKYYLEKTPNYAEGIYWHKKAAQQGYAKSQYTLGVLFTVGRILPRNYMQAMDWFKKAAYQGHVDAQYALGENYLMGRGVDFNIGKAIFWLEKSAQKGYGPAQYKLGYLYCSGEEGVPRNYMKGYRWTSLAGAQGVNTSETNALLEIIEERLPPSKIMEAQNEATKDYLSLAEAKKAEKLLTDKSDVVVEEQSNKNFNCDY